MGVKELLPAYLGIVELPPEDLLTGVSFASGGSGFDPLTPEIAVSVPPFFIIDLKCIPSPTCRVLITLLKTSDIIAA